MSKKDFEQRLIKIFEDFFSIKIKDTKKVNMKDLEVWDSISQLNLILEIESEFDIMFPSDEILKLETFETLLDKIVELKS